MTRSEHLLSCLAEECAEISEQCSKVAVRVSKALRFGLDEIQPGQLESNANRISGELCDLLAVAEMLIEEGVISKVDVAVKKLKVARFLVYAKACGALAEKIKL